ncbi:unnamed protein product, partial [Symbiodinium natans]
TLPDASEFAPILARGRLGDGEAEVSSLRWRGARRACAAAALALVFLTAVLLNRIASKNKQVASTRDQVGFSALTDAKEFTTLPGKQEQAAAKRDLSFNELHLPTVDEELTEEFHPALCVGQSLQAALTLAGLSIKVGAAMRECNAWFYSPAYAFTKNPITGKIEQVDTGEPAITNARRLKDKRHPDRRHPLLRIEESLRKPLAKLPTTPGLKQRQSTFRNMSKVWEMNYGDEFNEFKKTGETAYNVTEWDLSLDKMSFDLGAEWTFEGWHYFLAHGGVIWDTRRWLGNYTTSGLAVVLSKNGSVALMVAPKQGAPVARSCGMSVPLKQWVHVACQRRGSFLDFFLNGTKVCDVSGPNELDDLEPQTTVKIGRAATNEADSGLSSLVSNMRLTGSALYRPSALSARIPARHLDLHPKTRFLLQGGYLDRVSWRPLLISGHGLMEGVINRGHPTRKLKHPAMRELQLHIFPDQDRSLPGGLPQKWGEAGKRSAFCARTILTIIKDAGTIAASIESDLKVCQDKKLVGMECATAATRTVRSAGSAAKYMAELPVRGCDQKWFRGYARCAGRMEGVSWELDVLGTELGLTVESCHNLDLDYQHIRRKNATKKSINWGRCAGEVAASAGYASTAGLYVASAAGYDCPAALTTKKKKEAFNVSIQQPWAYRWKTKRNTPGDVARTTCAVESLGFARTLFLSGAKAARAGGSCSGTNTVCARNVLLSMAAFAGIGEVGGILHDRCLPLTSCCKYIKSDYVCDCRATERQKVWAENHKRSGTCARYSGSITKLIGSALTFAAEAVEACDDDPHLPAVCSSMVTFAIASLGYFAENAARNHYECPFYMFQNLYQCGQDQTRLAAAVQLFASATAAAVINCGALAGTHTPCERLVGMVHPPRRFFTV